jgi:hypothetical protein
MINRVRRFANEEPTGSRSLTVAAPAPSARGKWRCILPALVLLLLVCAPSLRAVEWETLFTAQDVRDDLATPAGRQAALQFCRRLHITKVYLEVFRDGYQADGATLREARDFFRQAGIQVSGCVATTQLGKPSTGWKIVACYTNRANQEHLASIFRFAAGLFNEIIIDDFFFTDCQCSECSAAKGSMSWTQYRDRLMVRVSRQDVLGPARAVNPKVKIILKYPQWYDQYQNRGYVVDQETALYDRIWVGTETRNPASPHWGHKQQYEGFFLYRWLSEIGGAKTGGGWFDPYGTDPAFYMDQAWTTVLAGAPEVFLFHYGSLISPQYRAQAQALAAAEPKLDTLGKLVGHWQGIAAYKPISSDPGSEPYIFDQIGMLGIPLLPTATFPQNARAAMFAEYAMHDPQFVPELNRFLENGGTAFLTEGLAHRLNRDPRLAAFGSLELPKSKLIEKIKAGAGKIVVFSDALPQLSLVDSEDRIEQPTPQLRDALYKLRREAANFVATSLDAPPRVAVFPMLGRVAVMNYTELPVACHVELGGMASRRTQVFAANGAALASDGETLRLPPHSLIVVE